MTNNFIVYGEILNTGMSIQDIEKRVQKSLNHDTGGLVTFKIKEISDKEIRIFFYRDCLTHNPNDPIIYDTDMNLISGLGIGAFHRMETGGYPLIFPLNFDGKNFYTDITAFARFYKLLLFIGAENQKVEHIGIRCYSDKILMQIIF